MKIKIDRFRSVFRAFEKKQIQKNQLLQIKKNEN